VENFAVSSLDTSRLGLLSVDTDYAVLLGCGSSARKGHHGAYTACHNSGGALVVASLDGQMEGFHACWLSKVITFAVDCSVHGIRVVVATYKLWCHLSAEGFLADLDR
jgi:hypothetical protein